MDTGVVVGKIMPFLTLSLVFQHRVTYLLDRYR